MKKRILVFFIILPAVLFLLFLLAAGMQFTSAGVSVHAERSVDAEDARININTASAEELELLPGIGPSLSRAIIEQRESAGGFQQVEDLMKVNGIGEKKLDSIRDMICCSEMR